MSGKDYNALALRMHGEHHGKIEIKGKVPVKDRDDLSTAYTPGVAEPCRKIAADPEAVWEYTTRGNMVAVVTDGTAVLGLGDIGPLAALPVMEGKALLFKEFGGVDAVPVCLDTKDAKEIVAAVRAIAPTYGGINLEDISAPRCFEIERGFMPDIEKIGAICRERSILFAVDAIQALGRVPVDVEKMNIDYLSTAAFKGLLGVLGSGFVYCCPKLQPMLKPEVYSDYNIVYDEETMTNMMQIPVLPYRQGLEAIQGGSVSSYGITAMGKSVELLLEIGIDRVYSHCLRLENLFRKGLSPLEDKVQILGSKDCKHWSGVICLKFDKDRTKQMKNAFADKKIYAHIREGYLRISFHYYNSPDQVLLTAQALTDVLK